ncbi:MAG: hypothetical protein NW241_14315 [Bacteroidia bacterium]|nr:hypothetical protein [Bacteroidia bacterium]
MIYIENFAYRLWNNNRCFDNDSERAIAAHILHEKYTRKHVFYSIDPWVVSEKGCAGLYYFEGVVFHKDDAVLLCPRRITPILKFKNTYKIFSKDSAENRQALHAFYTQHGHQFEDSVLAYITYRFMQGTTFYDRLLIEEAD